MLENIHELQYFSEIIFK